MLNIKANIFLQKLIRQEGTPATLHIHSPSREKHRQERSRAELSVLQAKAVGCGSGTLVSEPQSVCFNTGLATKQFTKMKFAHKAADWEVKEHESSM